ncbi:MAG: hypothetical protein AB3N21_06330 [Ruegeria sp.]|uniref:hypothetical protein n=1 Tax=Ruegeria sp. TaxID=1879320 RepID=UPI00349E7DCD
MIAALTLLLLLALSMSVVRIGSTALRLTGMEPNAARFQALSAFSGTGFTTSESEDLMRHPMRRKILVLLMIIGSLGVVTVLSTVVLGLLRTDDGSEFPTIVYMALAVMLICFLAVSKRLDQTMCALVERVLLLFGWDHEAGPVLIAELPNGDQLVEQRFSGSAVVSHNTVRAALPDLTVLRVNGAAPTRQTVIHPGDVLLCFAPRSLLTDLADKMRNL